MLGSQTQAGKMIEAFIENCSMHEQFAEVAIDLAEIFRTERNYLRTIELNKAALAHKPNRKERVVAYAGIAKAQIFLDEAESTSSEILADCLGVTETVDLLMKNFRDVKTLDFHIFQIGEEYYYKAHLDPMSCSKLSVHAERALPKAIAVWEQIYEIMPKSTYAADALYFSGASYRRLGEIEQMLSCYIALTDNWPDYKFNWSAVPYIGLGFQILKERGYYTPQESDPWIEEYYLKAINEYPFGCMADEARNGLIKLYEKRKSDSIMTDN